MTSVQPEWAAWLPIQQQSVLFLAARGPDGIRKHHPSKAVVRAYRGTVLVAAKYGRSLDWGETSVGDDFMALDRFSSWAKWQSDMAAFFEHIDELPHHYLMHLMHGAEILGYHHPDARFRERWYSFYRRMCDDMHLPMESAIDMDLRLNDWNREYWDGQ